MKTKLLTGLFFYVLAFVIGTVLLLLLAVIGIDASFLGLAVGCIPAFVYGCFR